MPMFEHLFQLFHTEDPEPADPQAYREALVDLLVWTMFVDHHLALAEKDVLDRFTADLAWGPPGYLEEFLRESTARAREVIDADADAAAAYLADIRARLPAKEDRRRVLDACRELINADGRLRLEEALHLKAVMKAFDL